VITDPCLFCVTEPEHEAAAVADGRARVQDLHGNRRRLAVELTTGETAEH
jgi:hypothetical protein